MDLILVRQDFTPTRTIGRLYVATPEAWTLEDVVRSNGPGEAIQTGRYRVIINKSQRFNRMLPLLVNVPNRDGIRIHAGNVADDTAGCILVGQEREQDTILHSKLALDVLQPKIADAHARGQDVWITIVENKA
jgi:hypothetical protein